MKQHNDNEGMQNLKTIESLEKENYELKKEIDRLKEEYQILEIIERNHQELNGNLRKDLAKLSKEVLYDPLISLEGGLTGLRSYFKIAKDVHKHLKKDGFVILEIGIGQLKQVDKIFLNQGFRRILKEKDLQGIDRVVVYQYKVQNT